MHKIRTTLYLLLICLAAENLFAQDAHYWTQTYGTRSTLLGGAVIGSVSDLGSTFYNPGNLALTNDPNFLFSAKVFELRNMTIEPENNLTEGISKTNFSPSPGFVVFNLTAEWLGKNNLAFSFLTRQSFDVRLKTRFVAPIQSSPVSNEILYEGDSNEYWGGITLSLPFRGTYEVGIGITNYFAIRSYRSRNSLNIQNIDSSGNVGIISGIREYDYYNVRVLWKAGVGFTFESIKFGLTLTTPSINLFGFGEADINLSSSGLDIDGDTLPDEFLVSDFQKDLNSKYNSAFAIGIGIYYKFSNFKIHFASEYYSGVSKFNVLTTETFKTQTGNIPIQNNLIHALKPVFNFGFGFEYFISDKFTTYGGFITDFSALDTELQTNHSVSRWNFYHISGGASVTFEKLEITFGLSVALASDDISVPLVPLVPSDELDLAFQQQDAKLNATRIKFILGLTF